MYGPKNLAIGDTQGEIERYQESTDEEYKSGSLTQKRHEKTSKIEEPRLKWVREDIFERYDRYPKHEKSDESDHIPGELVDDDEETKNGNDGREYESVIRTKNSRPYIGYNGAHRRAVISGKDEHSEKEQNPPNNRVTQFVTPGRTSIFFLFGSHENLLEAEWYFDYREKFKKARKAHEIAII